MKLSVPRCPAPERGTTPDDSHPALLGKGAVTATKELEAFCHEHFTRRVTFNDLRASFTTECFERGMTAAQESKIVGHSPAVAEKHYSEYDAREARDKLPPDPLQKAGEIKVRLKVAK